MGRVSDLTLRTVALGVALLFTMLPAPLPAQTAASGSTPIPIEALAAPAYLSEPVLSPDGRRIAARLKLQGKDWVGIWDLRAGPTAQPRLFEQAQFDVRWLRWAGPERLLIGIQLPQSIYGLEINVTRTLSLDVSSWLGVALETGRGILGDDVIFVDPAGAYALVSSQATATDFPDVLRIDLATGESSVAQRRVTGVWNWFADGAGVVRAGVEYRNNRIKLYYRAGPGADLRRIDTRRYPQDGSVIDMIRFVSNTNEGIVVTNAVTGRFAVYRYDFANDTRGEAIFEHPQVDVTSVITGAEGTVAGVRYEDDRHRVHWLDPALQRVQAAVDRALPDKVNLIVDVSSDDKWVLIWSGGADDPGTYYVFDRTARRIEAFAAPYEALVEHRFAPVRPIRFAGRDGTEIPGYLTLPPGRPERDLPLLLMPHGGPFARDSWAFDPWVQFLANRGYAVLQVNFRGSTGYGRAYVERGYGQLGTGMIDDLEDGVDWLVGQGIADARRVCVMGASYGGYAAMWAPIRSPQRYRCAISFAGVSDLRSMLRYDRRLFSAARYHREWQRQVRGDGEADLEAISPLDQAARARVPMLIAHGQKDRNVPISQSRNLVRALTRRNAPVTSVFYPEAGHGFARPQDSTDFLRRVEAFLALHNPADAPPAPPPVQPAG